MGGLIDIYSQRKYLLSDSHHKSIKNILLRFLSKFSNKSWIILGILCLAAIIHHILFQIDAVRDIPNTSKILWLEYFSRLTLYPLVYPFYSKLNDYIVLISFIIFLIYFIYAYIIADNDSKRILIILILGFLMLVIITTYGRPNMVSAYKYSQTFPDRYVYVINILFMVLIMYSLNIYYNKNKITKIFSIMILSIYITINILNIKTIIQYSNAIQRATHQISFKDRINEYVNQYGVNNADDIVSIDIDFKNWNIKLPNKYVICSYMQQNDIPEFVKLVDLSDDNWVKGVFNHDKSILLMKSSDYNLMSIVNSINIETDTCHSAKILEVRKNGNYIHVVTDMKDASIFAYPAKIEYELK